MQNNECIGDKKNLKEHWENVYNLKKFNEVSWYQENPKTSVDLIQFIDPDKNSYIIDIGGGDSKFVDKLIELGFKNIFVLDISLKALEKSKQRLKEKAKTINWINSDINEFNTDDKFEIWHDRAFFHFLITNEEINKYVGTVNRFLKPAGYLIISTFSLKGPKKCSGLDANQYSEDSIKKIFNNGFEYIKSFEEEHSTPFNTTQSFIWNVFKKLE